MLPFCRKCTVERRWSSSGDPGAMVGVAVLDGEWF